MPQQAATIESLPQAFEVVKEMQADGLDRGEGYRPLGRQAPAGIIEGRMAEAVDRRRGPRDDLASMAARACSPPCRSSGTASPSGGAGRTGSGTSSTGSALPTGRPSGPTSTPS